MTQKKSKENEIQQISTRRLPINFSEEDKAYFNTYIEHNSPIPYVRIIEEVDINSEGILFRNGRILTETFSHPENFKAWKIRSIIKTHAHFLTKRRAIIDSAVWVTDDWSSGYFHCLGDVAPKILIGKDKIDKYGLLLPAWFGNNNFASELIEILEIEKIRYLRPGEVVRIKKLYLPFHTPMSGYFNKTIVCMLRNIFRTVVTRKSDSERVYISRRLAAKRRLLNESQIEPILNKYGFRIVETEKLSLKQQIELFAGCQFMLSVHGAGLTNMLFMPPGSKVLELKKRDENLTNCYFNLSLALDHEYWYQFCQASPPEISAHSADLIIDVSKLEKILDIWFG